MGSVSELVRRERTVKVNVTDAPEDSPGAFIVCLKYNPSAANLKWYERLRATGDDVSAAIQVMTEVVTGWDLTEKNEAGEELPYEFSDEHMADLPLEVIGKLVTAINESLASPFVSSRTNGT
jgi:hypothetical protein